MKSGISLISDEMIEQIKIYDEQANDDGEFVTAAIALLKMKDGDTYADVGDFPVQWDYDICRKMALKPYKQRLVISGALYMAENDRVGNTTYKDNIDLIAAEIDLLQTISPIHNP